MNPKWRRFAPLGLVLFCLSALVAGSLYIVSRSWNLPLQISLILAVLGLAVFVALAPARVRNAFTGRQARFGTNVLVMGVAFIGILAIVNYLVYQNAKYHPKQTRWDLTRDKSNTLAEETLNALSQLPGNVTAQAFFSSSLDPTDAQILLDKYQKNGKGKFTYKFINWENNPTLATEAGITGDGQIVVKMGDRQELVPLVSQTELTSALIRLYTIEKRKIYFLQGEGEPDPASTDDWSYSELKSTLEGKNYTVDTLNLQLVGAVPEDAKLVVIAGPQQPLQQTSVDILSQYLLNGGSMVVLEGLVIDDRYQFYADPLAGYLASTWGIVLDNNVIIQVAQNETSLYTLVASYGEHLITDKMGGYTPVFFFTRSVHSDQDFATTNTSTFNIVELALSTPYYQNCFPYCAWTTTDVPGVMAWWLDQQTSEPPYPTATDRVGPIPLAVSSENLATGGRVVVFGNSMFASNVFRQAPGNQELLVNAIDWSIKQEQLINLTVKETSYRTLTVSALHIKTVTNLIFLGAVILLPGAVLIAGVVAWVIRRRRG